MKTRIVGLACAALLCGGVPVVTADPVVVTSGLISTDFTDVGVSLDLGSTSFVLLGPPGTFHMPSETGFQAGQTIDFSATVNGTFVTNDSNKRNVQLNLNLLAEPVLVTTTADRFGLQAGHLETPFRMNGTVAGTGVMGLGTLSLQVESRSGMTPTLLDADSADFSFSSSAPSPTPEPASVVLLGTGVLGVMRRLWA